MSTGVPDLEVHVSIKSHRHDSAVSPHLACYPTSVASVKTIRSMDGNGRDNSGMWNISDSCYNI